VACSGADCTFTIYCLGNQIKKNEVGGACGTIEGDEQDFGGET
jgi:hypothetical protein